MSPCGIEAQQLSTAIADIQSQLGMCVPSGTAIFVTLDGTGNPTDTPAYTISVPGGPSWQQAKTSDINYVPPPLTPTAAGIMGSAASQLIAAGLPVTNEAAAAAANPVGVIPGYPATPSGTQTVSTAPAIGTAVPATQVAPAPVATTIGGGVTTAASAAPQSTSGGISIWVLLIGGGLLIWLFASGGKK